MDSYYGHPGATGAQLLSALPRIFWFIVSTKKLGETLLQSSTGPTTPVRINFHQYLPDDEALTRDLDQILCLAFCGSSYLLFLWHQKLIREKKAGDRQTILQLWSHRQ